MRLIRAPESSQASNVSARRFPLAMVSSRSLMPWSPRCANSVEHDVEDLGHVFGGGTHSHTDRAGIVIGHPFRPDRVGQSAALPDLLEQPAGQSPAEHVVEHGKRIPAWVRTVGRPRRQDQMGLLGCPPGHPQGLDLVTRRLSDGGDAARSTREPFLEPLGHPVMVEVAGHCRNHVAGAIMPVEEARILSAVMAATESWLPSTSRPSG